MPRKRKGLPINGILLLDKVKGISSNKALQRAKFLFNAQKAGHTGSLDPLATGMLPVCFGEATKVCAFLLDSNKRYQAEVHLGITTDSADAEGEVIERKPVPELSTLMLESVLQQFRGKISQVPPMHSAIWHEGKRLYELARAGQTVDIKPREVIIHELLLLDVKAAKLSVEVYCSKGTYIRSLVRDIGVALGCGAYMSELRRLSVDPFNGMSMMTEEALQQVDHLAELLLPIDAALPHYPAIELNTEQAQAIQQGRKIPLNCDAVQEAGTYRLYLSGVDKSLLGLGTIERDGMLAPKRLMHL